MKLSEGSGRKGFTLPEVLMVVAIIAVLVAIALPILNRQLERSREAYDIYTMRQAASAAMDMYYSGVNDEASAKKAGMGWSKDSSDPADHNAYGAYEPGTGKFYSERKYLPEFAKAYGKGTKINGGTDFHFGNINGAYAPKEDYTKAVVMVAIYPNAEPAHAEVYWKNNIGGTNYVGGEARKNAPKYSISITFH